jgi:hypothetical protein
MLQEKPSVLEREQQALQTMKLLSFFCPFFALLDPDPADPNQWGSLMNTGLGISAERTLRRFLVDDFTTGAVHLKNNVLELFLIELHSNFLDQKHGFTVMPL